MKDTVEPTRSRTIRTALLGLTAVTSILAAAGCSGSSSPASTTRPAAPTSGSSSTSADPHSPSVVAASAVGTRSRAQVVELHAMGVGTTRTTGLPKQQLPAQARTIGSALQRQVKDATLLPPPAGSPAAALVIALREYSTLAGELARWNPKGASLPTSWFTRLKSADTTWRTAMTGLSTQTGYDLLAHLPTLILPAA